MLDWSSHRIAAFNDAKKCPKPYSWWREDFLRKHWNLGFILSLLFSLYHHSALFIPYACMEGAKHYALVKQQGIKKRAYIIWEQIMIHKTAGWIRQGIPFLIMTSNHFSLEWKMCYTLNFTWNFFLAMSNLGPERELRSWNN